MAWQKGPLPPDTYNWGGVVPTSHNGSGFFFADFCGDHVKVEDYEQLPSGGHKRKVVILKADEVAWWNNTLDLPPGAMGRSLPAEGAN